jgi:hypothetical protein
MDTIRGFESERIRGLRNATLGVSAFLFLMVPWRLSGGPGTSSRILLAAHGGVWGLLVLAYALFLHRLRPRIRSAEVPAFGLMLVGLGVTGTQLLLYGRLQETASTLLVSLASGVVLRKQSSLALFQSILLLTWGTLAVHVGGMAQMATWVFDLVLATIFAFSVQHVLERGAAAMLRRIERQRQLLQANAHLMEELRQSIENVQTLSGLIPICAHCKKIRNDEGYWEQVESYIRARSEAQFTHGICPCCAKEFLSSE